MASSRVQYFVCGTMEALVAEIYAGTPTGDTVDVGPIIQGAIGGILEFAVFNGVGDGVILEKVRESIEHILPQLRIAYAASKAGASQAGSA